MKHPLLRPFTVVTLNIWNRGDPWDERLPLIREGLRAMRPDVVALQEVLRIDEHGFDQAALIAEGLGYEVVYGHAWKAAPKRTGDGRSIVRFERGRGREGNGSE